MVPIANSTKIRAQRYTGLLFGSAIMAASLSLCSSLSIPAMAPAMAQGLDPASGQSPLVETFDRAVGFEAISNENTASQPETRETPIELDYDSALKALKVTKQHSQAINDWGERRTITVPQGVDPKSVIEKELSKIPALVDAGKDLKDISNPNQSTLNREDTIENDETGGWDWTSALGNNTKRVETQTQSIKDAPLLDLTGKQAGAPVPSQPVSKIQSTSQPVSNTGFSSGKTIETNYSKNEGQTSIQTNPSQKANPAALYNEAVKAHLAGRLDEAVQSYRAAIAANPKLGQAHSNLGLIYNQLHQYDNAIREFHKALAINPKDAITYNGIGASMRAQKDLDGAIRNWETAISINPKLATAHYNLGTAYEIKKDIDKALEQYQEAIKNDKRLGEAYYRSGVLLARKNRVEEAKTQLNKAIEVNANAEYINDANQRLSALEKGSL